MNKYLIIKGLRIKIPVFAVFQNKEFLTDGPGAYKIHISGHFFCWIFEIFKLKKIGKLYFHF